MTPVQYRLLQNLSHQQALSGNQLAEQLGVSRTAIWKQIRQLQDAGIPISAQAGQGYQLQYQLELLQGAEIYSGLQPQTARHLTRITLLPGVDSTSNRVAQQPESGAIACIAEHQSSGRGRRGKHWHSPACAGVMLSLRWPMMQGISALSMLSMQTGLAVAQAIENSSGLTLRLKWPNDIMLDGKKLGGILVEINGSADGPCTVIIGVGINVCWPPAALAELQRDIHGEDPNAWLPADCRQHREGVSRNRLVIVILDALVQLMLRIESCEPASGSVVDDWSQRDLLIDQAVLVETGSQTFSGTVRGISSQGGLLVDTAEGSRELHSSDVSIRLQSNREQSL